LASYNLPIVILGRSFKPGTDLCDGSTAELVAHYCATEFNQPVEFDQVSLLPAVYLLAHDCDHSDLTLAQGSVIVDMYRRFPRDREGVEVVWYGVTPPAPPL